ncbi:NAD(P)/FAD-dependent oxidoreductase [Dehalogenimonas alkenigignens]|uniref:NAD(P)/FAD-dependent oxidoreductase n=1 Tax=Dehalogenimonas alkenigignens TaxID=1217799 RepID=UPI0014020644|nr:FAD/NAD(P)-binding oxidoreductase [Dehalogenimonas alkenigignens]
MNGKTVLVLGGGIGGLTAANELRQRLGREHRIILVEQNPSHVFAPSLLWLMTSDRTPEQVARPLSQLLRNGVELVLGKVSRIDPEKRRVEVGGHTLDYDYLVVALGADLKPEAIPGLKEGAYTFYTLEGTIALRDALRRFEGGKIAVVVSAMPYKCPGAPHEAAMLINDFFRQRHKAAEIHLFTPEPQPLPVAGPQLGEMVRQMLESKSITFHPKYKLTSVDSQLKVISFEGQESFSYDLLIAIPPHGASTILKQAGLTNDAGWVPADRGTLATRHDRIFAIGDVAAIPLPGRWKVDVQLALPKAGVFAHDQALVTARRITAEINGQKLSDTFCGGGYCMLEVGGDLAGFASGDFFAEPPSIELHRVGKIWHLGKVLMEKWWLSRPGIKKSIFKAALRLGSKTLKIPASF